MCYRKIILACWHFVYRDWVLFESSVRYFVWACQKEQEICFLLFGICLKCLPEPFDCLVLLGKTLISGVLFHLANIYSGHSCQVNAELFIGKKFQSFIGYDFLDSNHESFCLLPDIFCHFEAGQSFNVVFFILFVDKNILSILNELDSLFFTQNVKLMCKINS